MGNEERAPLINTVTGPVDPGDLGVTMAHEHVLITSAGINRTYPELAERERTLEKAIDRLGAAREGGLDTIVDVTPMDLGRDAALLREVSEATGVKIVAATGVWFDVPRIFWAMEPAEIAPLFVREIEEGIEDSGVRAGVIKVASHIGGVTPQAEIVLRAAAIAQSQTGVPISCHSYAPERVGDHQLEILTSAGVDPSRIYIGHSDDSDDMDYLSGVVERGAWLGLDHLTFGHREGALSLERRLENLLRLLDSGHAGRIMFGQDWAVNMPVLGAQLLREREAYNPHGYLFCINVVIPRLREMGVDNATIEQITVENPRRFLTPA